MSSMIKVAVVGCGDRACVYAKEGVFNLKRMQVVAAVDPDPVKRKQMHEIYGVPKEMCFETIDGLLAKGKIADCIINGTMDQMHLETSVPFLKQGYDMLLEKPLVNNEKDLYALMAVAEENGCKLMTCHVLRYAPFYKKVKELILNGDIGEVVNIQTSERVGAAHSSMSYLRGKWKSEKECGSSLLLAKCCHDIDLICWLNNSTRPTEVVSYGGRNYFIPEKAPKGAGTKCLVDCPKEVREKCVYDVQSMYLDNCVLPWYPWQCTGKHYEDVTMEEKIESLKTYNPHGSCVYKAGGDIVDHQNVMMKFADGSTATHNVTLGVMAPGRSIWIVGTKGEIEGNIESGVLELKKYDKATSLHTVEKFTFHDTAGETGGHFGGDRGIVEDFCNIMDGKQPSISCTAIQDSIVGHVLTFKADESLKENKPVTF